MRQASISSVPLKNIGLVIGLGFIAWISNSAIAQAAPKITVMQEYCSCTCGDAVEVAVTPTTQPPNRVNCKAMDAKICRHSSGSNSHLSCNGSTIVAKPEPLGGVPLPTAPTPPAGSQVPAQQPSGPKAGVEAPAAPGRQ
jgi:hypothetical protein